MTPTGIVVTKECPHCGYVFLRSFNHFREGMEDTIRFSGRKENRICPDCNKPVIVVEVEHPGETL